MSHAVIGLGNVLLGDDGFGPFVIELLRRRCEFSPQVDLLDLGTPGLGLTGYLHGYDGVVVIDALSASGQPGEVRVYEGVELESMPIGPRVSPHDPALAESLSIARAAGRGPLESCLVGAVARSRELGAGLSPEMKSAANVAVEMVCRRLQERGVTVRFRRARTLEDHWWVAQRAV